MTDSIYSDQADEPDWQAKQQVGKDRAVQHIRRVWYEKLAADALAYAQEVVVQQAEQILKESDSDTQ